MVNKVILVGNIGGDAESPTENITKFTLATSEKWKNKDGEPQEETEWHRVVVYGKIAPFIAERAKKGSQAYVEGKVKTRKWTDANGVDKFTTEIIVDMTGRVQIFGSGHTEGGSTAHTPAQSSAPEQTKTTTPRTQTTPAKETAVRQEKAPEPAPDVYADNGDSNEDDIPF